MKEPRLVAWQSHSVVPVEPIELVRISETLNMNEAWWQYHFITNALDHVRRKEIGSEENVGRIDQEMNVSSR